MQNQIEKVKKYVEEHPEEVKKAKQVLVGFVVGVGLQVATHYVAEFAIRKIDGIFAEESGINDIPEA